MFKAGGMAGITAAPARPPAPVKFVLVEVND